MAQIEPITWFRNANPEQGSLRVQVSAAQGIFPIPGASVEVYRDFGAVRETFYSGVTDSSGIADRILLPALPASRTMSLFWPSRSEVTEACSASSSSFWV